MATFQQSGFPTVEDVMNLARSIVNDMFPGINNTNGRILTDDAPFTLPYINSAFKSLQRKLRVEGVTFPIKDNVILTNLTPIAAPDPTIQIAVTYSGYFDGVQNHATPMLPPDLIQPLEVAEQTLGTNLPFSVMTEPGSIHSMNQGNFLSVWEWRNYGIYMPGSLLAKNLRLRYTSGQPPLNIPSSSFASTSVNIVDSQEALAYLIAAQYALARGGASPDVAALKAQADEVIGEMALEFVRRSQGVQYRRPAYQSSGGNNVTLGSTGQNI